MGYRLSIYLLLLFSSLKVAYSQCTGLEDFSSNISTVCLPNAVVTFDTINIPPNATFFWEFGNDSTSTDAKAIATYITPGTFDVTLTVYLPSDTCIVIKPNLIKTFPAVAKPQIIPTDTLICNGEDGPFDVTFCNYASDIVKWEWVINSTTDTTSGNCKTYSFSIPRCYDISLEVTDSNGCTNANTAGNLLCIYNTIDINISPENPICTPLQGNYKPNLSLNGNTLKTSNWVFQGANPSTSSLSNPGAVTYSSSNCYDVNLTIEAGSGCIYQDTANFFIPEVLSFTVSPNPACVKEVVTLTNTTILPSCASGSIAWNTTGSSGFSFIGSPNVSPAKLIGTIPGKHNILLYYISGGCFYPSPSTQLEILGPLARFDFSPPNVGCKLPYKVDFTNFSLVPDNNATYRWLVFDTDKTTILGTYLTKDMTHTFNKFGLFDVRLIVNHPNGCTDSLVKQIQIVNPIADFYFNDTIHCLPGPYNPLFKIENLTQPGTDTVDFNFDWIYESMNDTFPYSDTKIPPLPNVPGIYDVTLIAYTDSGCADTITKQAYLIMNGIYGNMVMDSNKNCTAPFTNNLEAELTLNALYSDPTDSSITYFWSQPPLTPAVLYSDADSAKTTGTYGFELCYFPTVKLQNSLGCVTTIIGNVTIGTSAVFGTPCMSSPCCGLTGGSTCTGVKHDLFTCHCDPGITTYQWTSSTPTAILENDSLSTNNIIFEDTIPATIQLIVINDIGCTDTFSQKVVPASIFANFIADDTVQFCNESLIKFTDLSYGIQLKWSWTFGDSLSLENNSIDQSPAHVYDINHKGYTVTLVVTDSFGCTDTLTKPYLIKILGPIFNTTSFIINGCDSANIGIYDSSLFFDKIIIDYGDGNIVDTNISNFYSHRYVFPLDSATNNKVSYFPKIIISDSLCNILTNLGEVIVYQSPTINLGNDTTFCEPYFIPLNPGSFSSYNWSTGNSGQKITPTITANYWVEVMDTNSCIGRDSINLVINQRPDITTTEETTIITGQCTDIWARADIFSNYHWSPNSFINDTTITTPTVCPKDTTTYKVIMTSSEGCIDSSSVLVIVLEEGFIKTPNTFTPNGDGLNDEFSLINQGIKELFYIKIYNRWGQLVFESNDVNATWDGTKQGKPQEVGIYIFEYEGITLDNINQFKRGQLALVR